ncbi:MAG: hypothetical protein U0V70_01895 [Terriglobia bacterium]
MFERMEELTKEENKSRREQVVEYSLICVGVLVVLGIMALALIFL